ncbi:biotin--[acetyl-CoA-carboxylase] ligase [Flavobacterium sp. JP2137]|uniref:biotin--[acetyl-CoA-carboxylase] ligase n=1 Tax=Flavobacterium sp. JP2137 TaxID=3414510 RepID=UPI003D2FEA65
MNIIKLDATPSTNIYLKELLAQMPLENYTVVVTENQTQGRGQRGSKWVSESGSNLTFSVLIKDLLLRAEDVFTLNILVSVGIIKALENLKINSLAVKWPNDILSGNKKIGGILIENIFKSNGDVVSVVGIGLNVNQKNFIDYPQASSLSVVAGCDFDKAVLLREIVAQLIFFCNKCRHHGADEIWGEYHRLLFKKDVPSMFELPTKKRFLGMINAVTPLGELQVIKADQSTHHFRLKEIKMLY